MQGGPSQQRIICPPKSVVSRFRNAALGFTVHIFKVQ